LIFLGQEKPAPAPTGGVVWEPPQPGGVGEGVGGGEGAGGGGVAGGGVGGGGGGEGDSSLCERSHIDALFRTADGASYVFKGE